MGILRFMGAFFIPSNPTSPFTQPLMSGGLFLPHVFVVDLMPKLRDTEFRVLLVVYAQSLGFMSQGGKGRKERD